jgi:hypothetical protein
MQPDQRKAYLEATGVDPRWVPKSLLTEPTVIDPVQKGKIIDQLNGDIVKLANQGNLTPALLRGMVEPYVKSGILDQATADSILSNPEAMAGLGRGIQTKLQLLLQAGVLKTDQYNLAVNRLADLTSRDAALNEYDALQGQFIGFREHYMTVSQQQTQTRIGQENQRIQLDSTRIDDELSVGEDRLNHDDYSTLAQDTRSAEANYNTLLSTYTQLDTAGKADITNAPKNPDGTPAGESFAQTMADAKALRDKLQKQLAAANAGYRNPSIPLRKLGVQTPGGQPKIPSGATPGTLPNGQRGYQLNNKLYLMNGQPYTQ